jgi:hypothetical protein
MEARTSTNNVKTATQVTPASDNGYAKKTVAAEVTAPVPNLETEFIRQVRAQFFDASGDSVWPQVPQGKSVLKVEIATFELPNAVFAMFDSVERNVAFPDGMPGTAISLIKAAATVAKWPLNAEVPDKWKNATRQFHEFEIGVVTNIMLKAFNAAGGGGTPRDWPPTNP